MKFKFLRRIFEIVKIAHLEGFEKFAQFEGGENFSWKIKKWSRIVICGLPPW